MKSGRVNFGRPELLSSYRLQLLPVWPPAQGGAHDQDDHEQDDHGQDVDQDDHYQDGHDEDDHDEDDHDQDVVVVDDDDDDCLLPWKVSLPKVTFRGLWITGKSNKVSMNGIMIKINDD